MKRMGIAIAMLTSIVAGTLVTGSILTRAEATDGSQAAKSCATTAACVEGDNTAKGTGVKGTSTRGDGVVGSTKSNGTTQSNSHAGVLGQDLQKGGGSGNFGVEGLSTNGFGVFGSSGLFGVVGEGIIGVEGATTADGTESVLGIASGAQASGVAGESTNVDGTDVLAAGLGFLFRGNNRDQNDVFEVDNSGDGFFAGGIDLLGNIRSGSAMVGEFGEFGDYGIATNGVDAISESGMAVEAIIGNSGDAFYAEGSGANLFRGHNSQGKDVFLVNDAGDVFAHKFTSGFTQTLLQRTSAGQTVETYSSQAAQPTLEDDGEAQLVGGIAHVTLDPAFAATIDRTSYIVMVTPEGMTRGVLCVTQRTPAGFTIQESIDGRSTIPFAYRIVGKPYGSFAPRLPLANIPPHFLQRSPRGPRPPTFRPVPKAVHHPRPHIPH